MADSRPGGQCSALSFDDYVQVQTWEREGIVAETIADTTPVSTMPLMVTHL